MIVCHCRAVSHTAVIASIDSGARCPDEVAEVCGAGGVCGGCRATVEVFLSERHGALAGPLR